MAEDISTSDVLLLSNVHRIRWPQHIADSLVQQQILDTATAVDILKLPKEDKSQMLVLGVIEAAKRNPKGLRIFLEVLRSTAQSEFADELIEKGLQTEPDVHQQGAAEVLKGFIHPFIYSARHDHNGYYYTAFRLQTGRNTYVTVETENRNLHLTVLQDFVGNRAPAVELENFEVLDGGAFIINRTTRIRRGTTPDFERKAPGVEWASLGRISDIDPGTSINVRVKVVAQKKKNDSHRATSSHGKNVQFMTLVVSDQACPSALLSVAYEWSLDMAPGKAFEITNVVVKRFNNAVTLFSTELTNMVEIDPGEFGGPSI